jgi:hypothetical protein
MIVEDTGAEASKAKIEELLERFGRHKETLLSLLRDAYNSHATTEAFDAEMSWGSVEGLARLYYARDRVKQEATSNADREARYRKIAETLMHAREMIEGAINTPDLANDLVSAWWEGTTEYQEAAGRFVDLLYIEREFEKALDELAALATGAARAADGAHKGRGRPRGTSALSADFIYALAGVYRSSTGSKPGAGKGPFARFVLAFRTAIGRHAEMDAVIDAIKEARTYSLQHPSGWGSSPFDD